jgi:hypothetical protein
VNRLPTALLFADVALLGCTLAFAPPPLVFLACAPCGVIAVVACELLARREKARKSTLEPWRLDGWAVTVATIAVMGLGASIGPEAVGTAWLLVALFAGLGLASIPNLAPGSRA